MKPKASRSKRTTARNIDEYLSQVPGKQRARLEELRQTIKSIVPEALEVISYQIPTFKLDGRMLVSFAAFSDHCSFFPGAYPIEVHRDALKTYQTSKGTIRFAIEKPLPVTLVKKLVKARIEENKNLRRKRVKR